MGVEAGLVNKERKRNEILERGKQTTGLGRRKLIGKVDVEMVLQTDRRTS